MAFVAVALYMHLFVDALAYATTFDDALADGS